MSRLHDLAVEIAQLRAIGEPTTKSIVDILDILRARSVATSDICNWCGHPKRQHARHSGRSRAASCAGLIECGDAAYEFCRCTASRGVVRMPKRKEAK